MKYSFIRTLPGVGGYKFRVNRMIQLSKTTASKYELVNWISDIDDRSRFQKVYAKSSECPHPQTIDSASIDCFIRLESVVNFDGESVSSN